MIINRYIKGNIETIPNTYIFEEMQICVVFRVSSSGYHMQYYATHYSVMTPCLLDDLALGISYWFWISRDPHWGDASSKMDLTDANRRTRVYAFTAGISWMISDINIQDASYVMRHIWVALNNKAITTWLNDQCNVSIPSSLAYRAPQVFMLPFGNPILAVGYIIARYLSLNDPRYTYTRRETFERRRSLRVMSRLAIAALVDLMETGSPVSQASC